MVSVGIIFEPNSDYVYAINTVMAQSYDSLEIICSLYEGIDISAYDILDCIRVHRKDNVRRVHLICHRQEQSLEGHVQAIARECKGEYAIFLSSQDAFYDTDAVSGMVSAGMENDKCVCGMTVLYSGNEYMETSLFYESGNVECAVSNISESIFQGGSLLLPRSILKEICDNKADCVELITCGTPCLRHDVMLQRGSGDFDGPISTDHSPFLNYTNGIYLHALIGRILNENMEPEKIYNEIDSVKKYIIGKQRGGFWGLTYSDQKMLLFLHEIENAVRKYSNSKIRFIACLYSIQHRVRRQTRKQIRIAFFAQEYHLWPSLKSVYDAAVRDKRFLPELVHIPFEHPQKTTTSSEEMAAYKEAGYLIKEFSEYHLDEDSPDIVIEMKPYDSIPQAALFNNIDKVVRRMVYIRYAPAVNYVINEKMIEWLFTLPAYFLMWKCLAYTTKELQRAIQYTYRRGTDWLQIGHPRDDLTANDLNNEDKLYYEQLKEKARGRKVFVWNTNAPMVDNADTVNTGAFLKQGSQIIEYFMGRDDTFLIWRPHPRFFKALETIWGSEKTKMFFDRTSRIENIYIDRYKQYTPALLLSNALISDASSLIDLYILSLKPVLLTLHSSQASTQYDREFLDAVYVADDEIMLTTFAEMVLADDHSKRFMQKKYADNNYLSSRSNKTVAENLLDEIVKGIAEEETYLYCERETKTGGITFE